MDALAAFLRDHGQVHSKAVGDNPFTRVDRILGGLSEAELRTSYAGFNPVAWLFWHMARVEDLSLATWVFGSRQVFDDGDWGPRLGVVRPDDGFGMSKAEVAEVSGALDLGALDLGALRAYRDAVGRRTQDLAAGLWPDRWSAPITESDRRAAGVADDDGPEVGTPREFLLGWWGLHHNFWHIGQCVAIMSRMQEGRG